MTVQRTRPPASDDERPPGIIDTIGNAFAILNRRPYLILLPVVVDFYLWVGVRISAQPFLDMIRQYLERLQPTDPEALEVLRQAGEQYDLVTLLAVAIPSLLADLDVNAVAGVSGTLWITALPWWTIPAVAVVLGLAGVAIGIAYLTMLAYLVRGESLSTRVFLADAARNALRMIGFIGLAILTVLLVAFPALILLTALLLIGLNVVPLVAVLAWLAALWAFFLLFFAPEAIVWSNAGPLRAVYFSYNVVRRNAWATAGFIAVYMLIRTGLPLALQLFTHTPWGVPFAVVSNAYVASGLVTAALLFYRDRVRLLSQSTAPAAPGHPS